MSKPEISQTIGLLVAYPALVMGLVCYYTGAGLTSAGSFLINASGLIPTKVID